MSEPECLKGPRKPVGAPVPRISLSVHWSAYSVRASPVFRTDVFGTGLAGHQPP